MSHGKRGTAKDWKEAPRDGNELEDEAVQVDESAEKMTDFWMVFWIADAKLVGGLEHVLFFYIFGRIIPID